MPANNIKHGARSYLATGKLPDGCGSIQKALARLRRELNAAIEAKRTRSIADDLAVQGVMRFEGVALLWMRWLAEPGNALTIDQRLAITKEIRAATADRDRAVAGLKLGNADDGNVLNVAKRLYEQAKQDA
jgi:hypothetical protein